jgi:hypothetical protein
MVRAVALALLIPACGFAQKADKDTLNSALLWQDSVSFFITPPPGWILDSEVARNEGPMAVLFRRGESWQSGVAVMYANMLDLPHGGAATLAEKVNSEVADWARRAGDAVITPLPDVEVEGHTVLLRKFVSRSHDAYEAVAYFWQPHAAPILVLSARSENEFQRAYPDFLRLVKSYGKGPRITH